MKSLRNRRHRKHRKRRSPRPKSRRRMRSSRRYGDAATSPRSWTVITCVFLAISGGVRSVRDWGVSNRRHAAKQSPFPLDELPEIARALGEWYRKESSIPRSRGSRVRVTTSTEITRTTKPARSCPFWWCTGWRMPLHGHIPEICYPAAGFTAVDSMQDFELKPADLDKVVGYRGGYFAKESRRSRRIRRGHLFVPIRRRMDRRTRLRSGRRFVVIPACTRFRSQDRSPSLPSRRARACRYWKDS